MILQNEMLYYEKYVEILDMGPMTIPELTFDAEQNEDDENGQRALNKPHYEQLMQYSSKLLERIKRFKIKTVHDFLLYFVASKRRFDFVVM